MWNPTKEPWQNASIKTAFPHWVLVADALFFFPKSTISKCVFPFLVYIVQHLPIYSIYASREGLGKYLNYRVTNGGNICSPDEGATMSLQKARAQ